MKQVTIQALVMLDFKWSDVIQTLMYTIWSLVFRQCCDWNAIVASLFSTVNFVRRKRLKIIHYKIIQNRFKLLIKWHSWLSSSYSILIVHSVIIFIKTLDRAALEERWMYSVVCLFYTVYFSHKPNNHYNTNVI